jgi:hypothetical protein
VSVNCFGLRCLCCAGVDRQSLATLSVAVYLQHDARLAGLHEEHEHALVEHARTAHKDALEGHHAEHAQARQLKCAASFTHSSRSAAADVWLTVGKLCTCARVCGCSEELQSELARSQEALGHAQAELDESMGQVSQAAALMMRRAGHIPATAPQ